MTLKQYISFIFLLLICFGVSAQVGINTATPHPSAVLDLTSSTNNKGFLPPRLTSAQRDAIASPSIGLIIYNTTTNCLNFYANAGWNETCGNLAVFTGTLVCANAVNTGTLTSGVGASGVSSSVPYTGGIGGNYGGQTVISTGVTGLTAFLGAGVRMILSFSIFACQRWMA